MDEMPDRVWITHSGWSQTDCCWKFQIGTNDQTVAYSWVPGGVGDRTAHAKALAIAERICEGWNA